MHNWYTHRVIGTLYWLIFISGTDDFKIPTRHSTVGTPEWTYVRCGSLERRNHILVCLVILIVHSLCEHVIGQLKTRTSH